MRRKKAAEPEAREGGDARITPVDVQQVEFRLAFRGYNERDVDGFLDRITEDLASYAEENRRLRAGAGPVPAGDGSATADASGSDEILARAREEASAIVRRAEQEAAAIRAVAGATSSGDARAAVAPLLNMERDFLQSLGTLVQTHAEEIRQMVLALRARAGSGPQAAPAPDEPEAPVAGGAPPGAEHEGAASTAEIRERLGTPEEPSGSQAEEPKEPERRSDEPVVIESATEPAYSSEGVPANEGRERSLRELFWGED